MDSRSFRKARVAFLPYAHQACILTLGSSLTSCFSSCRICHAVSLHLHCPLPKQHPFTPHTACLLYKHLYLLQWEHRKALSNSEEVYLKLCLYSSGAVLAVPSASASWLAHLWDCFVHWASTGSGRGKTFDCSARIKVILWLPVNVTGNFASLFFSLSSPPLPFSALLSSLLFTFWSLRWNLGKYLEKMHW